MSSPVKRDRRRRRRVVFAAGERPRVVVRAGDWEADGRMVDLSEGGVMVALRGPGPEPLAPPEAEGRRFELQLVERASTPTIGGLSLMRSRVDDDGALLLTLAAEGDAERGRLWMLTESFTGGFEPVSSASTHEELPKLPGRGDYSDEARVERLSWLAQTTGAALTPLYTTQLSADRLSSNIENMIGAIEVPVGVAGPLRFRGENARGLIYGPFATTEGALVASATRGATALSKSGGVVTRVLSQRMLRVPCVTVSSLRGASILASWIRAHVEDLRDESRKISRHGVLTTVEPTIIGNRVNIAFVFETGDAAGQNMTTACTWHCCQWMLEQARHLDGVRIDDFIIEANMSGDKKVTYQSFMGGRGIRVVAEATLPVDVLSSVLKVTPDQLMRATQSILAGSIQVGMIGFNINVANVIAAMFTALGQDIACVHECSIGQLSIDVVPEGIYASLLLPALIIGTVGGGTHLPGQSALLDMLGCAGSGKVLKLAEIIAGFCLALDLSTLSAVASGQFATAHERLGRNRPIDFFGPADLVPEFFTPGVQRVHGDASLEVRSATPQQVKLGSSIVTELTGRAVSKKVGLYPYQLVSSSPGGEEVRDDVLVKVKPLDDEVILMVNRVASMCGPRVANAHNKAKHRTGFRGCHVRELAVYAQVDPRFTRHSPKLYAAFQDESREAYVLVLERLTGATHLDLADQPGRWDGTAIAAALRGISEVHAIWLGREEELLSKPWIGEPHTGRSMHELRDLWGSLAVHASGEFPELVTQSRLDVLRKLVRTIAIWWPEIEPMPRTLIHGDFNPRNACLRDGRLCAYDWELATLHLPQRDVVEFLSFVLPPDIDLSTLDPWIEFARRSLEKATGASVDPERYRRGFLLALRDFAVNRLMLYFMAHTLKHYKFLPRVAHTTFRMLELLDVEALPDLPLGGSAVWPVAKRM